MDIHRARCVIDEMRAHIDSHLVDTELSPLVIARVFGVSERYVHKCFAEIGTTFGTYVRKKRLLSIYRELVTLEKDKRSIAEIALASGFKDISTFIEVRKLCEAAIDRRCMLHLLKSPIFSTGMALPSREGFPSSL